MKFRVRSKSRKYVQQARVAEWYLNQKKDDIVSLIEKRMELYYRAICNGKSDEEACRMVGLDPTKPAVTYGDRKP